MKTKKLQKHLWSLTVLLLLAMVILPTAGASSNADGSIIDKFKSPDSHAKPMARMWFPDAGAGANQEGRALVHKQIVDMHNGGFGGVEIAYLADNSDYDNADAKEIGFGSENWRKILKQLLQTANKLPKDFKIDITITSHWPPIVNIIDPNDDEQQQEALIAYEKISADDLAAGMADVAMPPIRTRDFTNPFSGGSLTADFVFVNKLRAVTLAQVYIQDKSTALSAAATAGDTSIQVQSTADLSAGMTLVIDSGAVQEVVTITGISGGGGPPGQPAPTYVNLDAALAYDHAAGTTVAYEIPTFIVDSLSDVTPETAKKVSTDGTDCKLVDGVCYVGTPAGVPDEAYAAAHGIDYQTVLDQWGPEPAVDPSPAKIDAEGNRRRMADWQYYYKTDLSEIDALQGYTPSEGDGLADGDYVLIGTYSRGTGQVMSGGASVTQYNRTYATDYFSDIGVQKVFEFWDKNILDDEMLTLLKKNGAKNGSSIFEDSIEIHHDNTIWTYDLIDEMTEFTGYEAIMYAPILAANSTGLFDDSARAERIKEDFNLTLGNLYATEHAALISEWAGSFNYSYRAQGYSLPGLDIAGAALALDIPEGDNSTSGDGLRNLVAAVNLGDKSMLSMESTTFSANINSTWPTVIAELNRDFSHGVNRSILHGSAFARSFNGFNNAWPGWNFNLGFISFSSWNARQIWWDDVDNFSGYVARTQSVMQNGKAKVDLAVLLGTNNSFNIQSGNSLQELLNKGYSYNLLSEALLKQPGAVVTNGMLAADGPAYRALIVKDATRLSVSAAQKLIDYANAGLPVILYNSNITRVYGTERGDNTDAALADKLAELAALPNVSSATTQAEILSLLANAGVAPAASYSVTNLEASHRKAAEGDYYYLYNAGTTLASDATAGDTGIRVTSSAGLSAGDVLMIDKGAKREIVTIASIVSPAPPAPEPNVLLTAPLAYDHAGSSGGFGPVAGTPGAAVNSLVGQTLTLAGSGTPYVLDAYTGEITPVAEYTTDDGTVSLKLPIEVRESKIVVLASNTAKFPKVRGPHATSVSGGEVVYIHNGRHVGHLATEPGDYTVSLSDGRSLMVNVESMPDPLSLSDHWKLDLESWGPDPAMTTVDPREDPAVDPTHSVQTTVFFDDISLGTWTDLPATPEQLSTLGVSGMGQVSGIGTYSTSFTLADAWFKTQPTVENAAYLRLTHNSDMIAAVIINGRLFDDLNVFTDTIVVPVGKRYLKPGTNTLTVKLDTTLNNRMSGSGQTYGLTNVELLPYQQTWVR